MEDTNDNNVAATVVARNPDALLAAHVDVIDTSERRASPFSTPLRTVAEGVRIEEPQVVPIAHREHPIPSPRRRGSSGRRQQSSHRVTYEDLAGRPRSNPRSRTPMRYESPLEHGAFRRDANDNSHQQQQEDDFEPRTITIRPGAGLGVGVSRAMPERVYFDDTSSRPKPITLKSVKQGPSQRKTRRWNNDNFVNTVKDLSNAGSSKSRAAAEILAAAKADAKHYLPVYDPADTQRSQKVEKFMTDSKYREARDQFFRGELHASTPEARPSRTPKLDLSTLTPEQLFFRIDGRLRRVVVKACENSAPACMVLGYFEEYLIKVFQAEEANCGDIDCDFWKELLTEKPTISNKNWNNQPCRSVTFLFDGESSTGGFHRLLVSAVSSFHCLKATTSTDNERKARVLSVYGILQGEKYRLLDHLESLQEAKQRQ